MNHNKNTLDTYGKISESYDKANSHNDTIKLQRELFYALLRRGVVYDFGCGTGRDVFAFSQLGFDVTGFDASEAMLSIAKEKYPHNNFKLLNLLDEEWHIPNKADGIWACASLLHFEQPDFITIFHRLNQQLNENGLLYFSVKLNKEVRSEIIGERFFQFYTKEWLDDFLSTILDLNVVHFETNIHNDDEFASYFLRKSAS